MPLSTFDTHAAVSALRDAGIDEAHAIAIVNTVRDARVVHTHLATKGDIEELRAATRAYMAELRGADHADIKSARSESRWMLSFLAALMLAMAARMFGFV